MQRRKFITLLGGAIAAWPLAAHAQQPALPVVAFVRDGSLEANAGYVAAFRKGLNESGYVESQNVTVEYHWLEGQYDRLPALMADLARRVTVIATVGNLTSVAAKAATATTPIVRRRRGSGSTWSCHQPRPAWWQRNRHQFSRPGNGGQAVAAPA
jgi:putative ABC transport system substrate-binding protein